MDSEQIIYKIFNTRDFVSGNATQKAEKQQIKDIVIDNGFVDTLKKSIAILASIDHLIVKYQSDAVPVSEVLHDLTFELVTSFAALKTTGVITEHEHQYLVKVIK